MLFHKKWELKIDVLNNLCGLKLIRMTIYNSNCKIIFNIDWEFRLKINGLDCFKFTYIKLNANKRNCISFLSLIISTPSIIWWKVQDFFVNFFYCNTWKQFKFIKVVFDCVILCFAIPAFCFLNFLCVRF
jgi:hypothetical protein